MQIPLNPLTNLKQIPKRGALVVSEHLSTMQCRLQDGRCWDASITQRGGIAGPQGSNPDTFEVACNPCRSGIPEGASPDDIRKAVIAILREKARNDLECANALLDRMHASLAVPPGLDIIPEEVSLFRHVPSPAVSRIVVDGRVIGSMEVEC